MNMSRRDTLKALSAGAAAQGGRVLDRHLLGYSLDTLANADFPWYLEQYRRHATIPKAPEATPEELRPLWQRLSQEVRAWPVSNELRVDHFHELLPVYRAAEAVAGTVKVEQVVDTSYLDQALKELSA